MKQIINATDIHLRGGAELHRITEEDGTRISVIMRNGAEQWACYRQYEDEMIARWNRDLAADGQPCIEVLE